MKKIIFFILLFIPLYVYALEYPSTDSKYVEVYDLNDKKILYEDNSNEKVSIASLTKIATTITAIENIDDLDEEVTITSEILNTVSWEASIAGLKAGDKVTYRDLLYASMLPSGADATNSIAILSSGNIDNFVNKMNELVNRIGLKNTHFKNVTGLDSNDHYSTTDEVRKLLEYSLKNETFREVFTTKEYKLSNGLIVKTTLNTYNKNNIYDINKILGSKTGYTESAGYCLASLNNINGHEILILVLKASSFNGKYFNMVDTYRLIDFLNTNYKEEVLVEKDKLIKEIDVILSNIDNYKVYSKQEVRKYLPSDYDISKLSIKYDGLNKLSFWNRKDKKIGTISYYYDDELVLEEDVILDTKIHISKFIILIIIIIVIVFYYIKKLKRKNKRRKQIKKRK